MKHASYVFDYNYEPKSGPLPKRKFDGLMKGLNKTVWKVTEEQGTKDWFLLRRFMLTSTSAIHVIRTLEKMPDVPYDLKEHTDTIAKVLTMRVTNSVPAVHVAAVSDFMEHLRSLNLAEAGPWFNGEYMQKKITIALIKQALVHLHVSAAGRTSKEQLGNLLIQSIDKSDNPDTQPDKDLALCVLDKWFMAPIKGEATKGLREGLANEAEVLRLLKDYFLGAEQPDGVERIVVVKILHVGLLESKQHERVGSSVDAVVLLNVKKPGADSPVLELACVEIKTKTSIATITEQERKLLANEVESYKWLRVNMSLESAQEFQKYIDVVDHRCQTLHHAAALGVRKTIYVVAAWKRIIRAVVLDFDDEVRDTHLKVMNGIWKEYLWIYNDPHHLPDHFQNVNLGYVGKFEDLQFSIALTNGLRELVKKEGCRRTAKDIVPLGISTWNHLKGGVDITSRYLKDCQAEMEAYCTPSQRIFLKIIKMYLLNAFRIHCAANTYEDLAEGHITSWKELRRSIGSFG